jgi:adaptin ear-binding coat-associated protein 1/2
MNRDPLTNAPLPPNAIQRVLYITPKVHIYRIPPINSTKGFNAASWTQNPADKIFTARMRVVETAIPQADSEKVTVSILLEDPSSGDLFAAAPYTHQSVVEQALDSSRFFAMRVVGGGGQKATLGLGFEERPEAFDFGVSLQDVRRTLKMDGSQPATTAGSAGGRAVARGGPAKPAAEEPKRDLSLKEGEMITINIGGKGRRHISAENKAKDSSASGGNPFAILPPPPPAGKSSSSSSMAFLPPPPSAGSLRSDRDKGQNQESNKKEPSAEELGFDDGEFGEFV